MTEHSIAFSLEKIGLRILQVHIPIYHPDGDMIQVYIEESDDGQLRITDFGHTIMRLSFTQDVDNPTTWDSIHEILRHHQVKEHDGSFYIDLPEGEPVIIKEMFRLITVIMKVLSKPYWRPDDLPEI